MFFLFLIRDLEPSCNSIEDNSIEDNSIEASLIRIIHSRTNIPTLGESVSQLVTVQSLDLLVFYWAVSAIIASLSMDCSWDHF